LVAKVAGKRFLEANRSLLVELAIRLDDAESLGQFLLRERLHPHQQPATIAFASRPLLDVLIKLAPSAEVEVSDAEVRPLRNTQGRLQRRQ